MLVWIEEIHNLEFASSFPNGLVGEIPEDLDVFISANISRDMEHEEEVGGWAIVSLRVRIEAEGHSYISLETAFRFGISEMEPKEKKIFRLPKQVKKNLLGTSVSTLRGLLYAYTSGTALEDFVLPMINEGELLDDMKKNRSPKA